jgi:hypothetical protein
MVKFWFHGWLPQIISSVAWELGRNDDKIDFLGGIANA